MHDLSHASPNQAKPNDLSWSEERVLVLTESRYFAFLDIAVV